MVRRMTLIVTLVCMAWGTASAQYLVSTKELGPKKQYTDNKKNRSYIVAGCLPKKMPKPSGFTGSSWIACNDLNYVKDKVVESEFISCIDKYPNGVVSSFTIEEFKNRKWKSFKFGCKNMGSDGKLSGAEKSSKKLFNYSKSAKSYSTSYDKWGLAVGVAEYYNKMQLKESLPSVSFQYQNAETVYSDGQKGRHTHNTGVSPFIPKITPTMIGINYWQCPPGKVFTGVAIGHIPNKKDKYTRPVYILAECRKLLKTTEVNAKTKRKTTAPQLKR